LLGASWKAGALEGVDPYPMVRSGAGFLIRHGPATQQDRWEECSGYSPSTLAATIAALICAADFADSHHDEEDAAFIRDYADFLESHVERWTVTTEGTLVPGIPRHYIRISPVAVRDPEPDENPNTGMQLIHNRPPGERAEFPAKEIVDAGFLELVRYGIRSPGDPLVEASLNVADAVLKVQPPSAPAGTGLITMGMALEQAGAPISVGEKGGFGRCLLANADTTSWPPGRM